MFHGGVLQSHIGECANGAVAQGPCFEGPHLSILHRVLQGVEMALIVFLQRSLDEHV